MDLTTLTRYGGFSSKQTGNTVFLTQKLVKHPDFDEEQVNIYFSFTFFIIGIMLFGHIGHLINPRRRLALLMSACVQAILAWTATILVLLVSDEDVWPVAAAIVAILAIQFGGQISLSIQMSQQELNTTMVTGALIQICRDPNLFKLKNTARNRRIAFVSCYALGCASGGVISKERTPAFAFVTYAVCKTALGLSFLSNPAVEKDEHGKTTEPPRRRSRSPIFRIIWGDP